jgi:hypothetical protein
VATTAERCTSCGAKVSTETGACAYCGSGAPAHGAAANGRVSKRVARFDLLAEHADFDKWMRHRPKPPRAPRSKPALVVRAKPYPAIVVAKRSEMAASGRGETLTTSTAYFVTLEFRTGTRSEYQVDGEFHGLCVDDDIGVAYFRGREFVGFARIDV